MALQQSNIAEIFSQFVSLMLFAGFIAAVIMNYQDWATGIAVNGLRPLTGELTGNSVDAGQPLAMAAAVVDKILPVMGDAGIMDFGEVYLYVTCMLIILVVFVLISALVILVTCEFYIVANIGVLLVGLGGSKLFKDYAINVMRYILAVAFKLFVLQLIVNIGFAIISLTDLDATVGSTVKSIKFVDLFYLIGKAIILLALAKSLPETCAGIINGSAISGGNPIAAMARSAGLMAVGAVSGGVGYAVGAAQATNAAHTVAKENGATGFGGTLGGMARAAWNARNDAKAGQAEKNLNSDPGSIKNQLVSAANLAKAKNLMDDESADSSSSSTTITGEANSGTAVPSMSAASEAEQRLISLSADQATTASPVIPAGGTGYTGNAQPVNALTPDVSGSPTPEAKGGTAVPIPSAGNPGGSGAPAPQANGFEGTDTPSAPKNPVASDYSPKTSQGTVDMRTIDPSLFKK